MTLPRHCPSTTAILACPWKFAPRGSGFINAVTLKGKPYVTEFDIGEFIIHGDAREVDGEFQAVIIMRAKPPLNKVTAPGTQSLAVVFIHGAGTLGTGSLWLTIR